MINRSKRDLRELYKYIDRKPENPTIKKIFFDENTEIFNYNPPYQRNFVWSIEKATKLIETILMNGEIPPITVTRINNVVEIIDGRQRYESLLKFCNNKFRLKRSGLSVFPELEGENYQSLPDNAKEIIQSYKLKMIVYSFKFGMDYPIECEENLKRDLFRRFNSGLTSLSKHEIARASYAYDKLTKLFENKINNREELYIKFAKVFIPKSKIKSALNDTIQGKLAFRDISNLVLVNIRELLTIPYISIIDTPSVQLNSDIIDTYYLKYVLDNNYDDIVIKFEKIIEKIIQTKDKLEKLENPISNNILFFKAVYWMLSILYEYYPKDFYDFDINKFIHYIEQRPNTKDYFENYKNMTAQSIISRHEFMKNYLNNELNISIDEYINNLKDEKIKFKRRPKKVRKNNGNWTSLNNIQNVPGTETTFQINDIIDRVDNGKFIIQPFFQRSEVKNKKIASKIIESIILGIKLPPVYIYSKFDNGGTKTYEVIDGQQRIISILSYLGKFVDNKKNVAAKNKFKLINLRNSQFINNETIDQLEDHLKSKIENYELDCIEINENANKNFKPVDLFLRLNSKPYPIIYNSFEMWNSFDCTDILNKIKEVSKKYSKDIFRQSAKKMKNEELITTLAYLHYKNINIDNVGEFFKIYVYLKDNEIKITFDKKGAVTILLETIEIDKEKNDMFINSIEQVELFAEKIKVLLDNDYNKLSKILNPFKDGISKARAKDFYMLYLILQELNIHIITTYKNEIINDISEIYKIMRKTPENIQIEDFMSYVKRTISKYIK